MKSLFSSKKKTVDDEYEKAKRSFKLLSKDYTKLSTTVRSFTKNVQKLSENVTKLCEDTNGWFSDAPREEKVNSIEYVSFSRNLDVQVFNRFVPGVNEMVVVPLVKFERDIEAITQIKQNRSKARKNYDNALNNSKKTPQKDIDAFKEAYEKLNRQFIDAVNLILEQRPKKLDVIYHDFLALYTTFIRNQFDHLSNFRGISKAKLNMFVPEEKQESKNPFA